MGEGKVKFGHDGFNQRVAGLPYSYSLACENVFMCNGYSGDLSNVNHKIL